MQLKNWREQYQMDDTTRYANSVFEQPWWLDTVAQNSWGEVTVKEGEEVVARLPYVIKKGKICMPPLTQTLGPWIKTEYREYKPGNTQFSKQKEIITDLISKLPKHSSFKMCFDSANSYILPYRWLGFHFTPAFSYRIPDLSDLSLVYTLFNKTAKKNIKYASNKVKVIESEDPENMIDLLVKTFDNQSRTMPIEKTLLKKIVENSIKRDAGKLFVAIDKKNNIHSSGFFLYDKNVCYYLLGGTDPKFRSSGSQSLILWNAIQFSATVSRTFDFEGSMVEGIENFFRQFGGNQILNYVVSKQSLFNDFKDILKPRIKKILGYKV
jgi:hypothetical protein